MISPITSRASVAAEVMAVEERLDRGLDHRARVSLTALDQPLQVRFVVVRPDRDPQERRVLPVVDRNLDVMRLVEAALQRDRVLLLHRQRPHERCSCSTKRPQPERSEPPLRLVGERLRRLRVERGVRGDRCRDREVGRRIARALPPVSLAERCVLLVAPAHDERLDPVLMLRPGPEEAAALRRAQPLVTVARRTRPRPGRRSGAACARGRGRRRRSTGHLPSARLHRSPRSEARAPSAR